jgi:hypothetical protein
MKNFNSFRQITLLILLIGVSISACKKGNDPVAPDAASVVAGDYSYSELTYNGTTLPADKTDLKGYVKMSRQTATLVNMTVDLRIKSSNEAFIVEQIDEVEVTDLGSGAYGLRYGGEEFAQVKGNKITIKGVDEDNVNFKISAIK